MHCSDEMIINCSVGVIVIRNGVSLESRMDQKYSFRGADAGFRRRP